MKVLLVYPADPQMVGIKLINLIGYLDEPRRKSQLLRFSKGQRQIKKTDDSDGMFGSSHQVWAVALQGRNAGGKF